MTGVNPSVRGFAILILIAAAITALGAEAGLFWILLALRIAFIAAIVYVVYNLWRSRREEISTWSVRARAVFYGGAGVAIVNLVASFVPVVDYPTGGLEILVFFAVFVLCGFAMWRIWRDEHSYGF